MDTNRWQYLSDLASWLEDELSEHPAKRETASDAEAVLVALDGALAMLAQPDHSDFEVYALHHFLAACSIALGSPGSLLRRKTTAVEAVTAAVREGRIELDDADDRIPF